MKTSGTPYNNLAKRSQLFEIDSTYKEHYIGAIVTKEIVQNLEVECPVLFHPTPGVRCIDQTADRPQGRPLQPERGQFCLSSPQGERLLQEAEQSPYTVWEASFSLQIVHRQP